MRPPERGAVASESWLPAVHVARGSRKKSAPRMGRALAVNLLALSVACPSAIGATICSTPRQTSQGWRQRRRACSCTSPSAAAPATKECGGAPLATSGRSAMWTEGMSTSAASTRRWRRRWRTRRWRRRWRDGGSRRRVFGLCRYDLQLPSAIPTG